MGFFFKDANCFEPCHLLSGRASSGAGTNSASLRRQPYSQRFPLPLRGPLFVMGSLDERKWKKSRELEDCSSEVTIRKHWGVGPSNTWRSRSPSSYEDSVCQQEAGPTLFAPFDETSDYFGDAHKVWMVNFRVLH